LTLVRMLGESEGLSGRAVESVDHGFNTPSFEAFQLPPYWTCHGFVPPQVLV